MKILQDSIIEPKPTDKTLNYEESLWKIKLPNEYATFIKEFNGCIPQTQTVFLQNREYVIERFLCILEESEGHEFGSYDIDVVLTQIEDRLTDNEDLIGVEVLPIAQLFSGDYLCLNFKKNIESPSVVIWSHEESGELEPVLYEICDTFKKFLEIISK